MLNPKALAANSDGLMIFGVSQNESERKIEVGLNEEDTNWVPINYGIHRNTFVFNEEVYDMEDFPRVNVDKHEDLEIRHMGDPIKETGIYARKEEKLMYKVDEIVKIVANGVDHGFSIGQHVRLTKIDRNGNPDEAESLDGQEDWCVDVCDVEKLGGY
jgi:hypothetical protein